MPGPDVMKLHVQELRARRRRAFFRTAAWIAMWGAYILAIVASLVVLVPLCKRDVGLGAGATWAVGWLMGKIHSWLVRSGFGEENR